MKTELELYEHITAQSDQPINPSQLKKIFKSLAPKRPEEQKQLLDSLKQQFPPINQNCSIPSCIFLADITAAEIKINLFWTNENSLKATIYEIQLGNERIAHQVSLLTQLHPRSSIVILVVA